MNRIPTTKAGSERWYKHACEKLFMSQFHGKPCEVCLSQNIRNTHATAGHHVITKSRCPRHKFSIENIVVLCQKHHMFDRDICPHSMNAMTVKRFLDWLAVTKPVQYAWCEAHEHDYGRIYFRELYETLTKEIPCRSSPASDLF